MGLSWLELSEDGPNLNHPNDEDLSLGTPVSETWGTRFNHRPTPTSIERVDLGNRMREPRSVLHRRHDTDRQHDLRR
jgi:hypothetical protein